MDADRRDSTLYQRDYASIRDALFLAGRLAADVLWHFGLFSVWLFLSGARLIGSLWNILTASYHQIDGHKLKRFGPTCSQSFISLSFKLAHLAANKGLAEKQRKARPRGKGRTSLIRAST